MKLLAFGLLPLPEFLPEPEEPLDDPLPELPLEPDEPEDEPDPELLELELELPLPACDAGEEFEPMDLTLVVLLA